MMSLALVVIGYTIIHGLFVVFTGGVLRTFIHTYAMLFVISMWPVVFENTALDRLHIESWSIVLIFIIGLGLCIKFLFTNRPSYFWASMLASSAIWLLV